MNDDPLTQAGWAAINLDMPPQVPRTEYSAESHWPLVQAETGIEVSHDSPPEVRAKANTAFRRTWEYTFHWSVLVGHGIFGDLRTDMGHAEYAAGGVDRRDTISCPFNSPEEVLAFHPADAYGPLDADEWVGEFERHYQAACEQRPFGVNMTGIYVTLISGLIDIFGWDMMLMAAGTDPDGFGEVANRYARWIQPLFEAMARADVPIVMVHDDIVWTSGPFVHPDWYRKYVFPHYHTYFEPLRAAGTKIAYTSDGTYTMFVDDIAQAGVDGFVLEPTTDMAYIAEHYGRSHFFIGNADTRILLKGDKPAIRAEVERCMSIGKDCPGFFLAVGNHIPSNTPVEAAQYYNQCYLDMRDR